MDGLKIHMQKNGDESIFVDYLSEMTDYDSGASWSGKKTI
jgi:hypothetical protein